MKNQIKSRIFVKQIVSDVGKNETIYSILSGTEFKELARYTTEPDAGGYYTRFIYFFGTEPETGKPFILMQQFEEYPSGCGYVYDCVPSFSVFDFSEKIDKTHIVQEKLTA